MLYSELNKIATIIEPANYGSAGIVGDSIHMGRVHHVAFLITFGALTGNSILSFYEGAAVATKTTQVAFSYRLAGADYKTAISATLANNADSYGALTAVAATGLTLTATTFDHRAIIVEFGGAGIMTQDVPYLTLDIDATATVMNVACMAVARPRFKGYASPSLL